MAPERNDVDGRHARVDRMIAEFRAARQRRLVKQGIDRWNRTEQALGCAAQAEPSPRKVN